MGHGTQGEDCRAQGRSSSRPREKSPVPGRQGPLEMRRWRVLDGEGDESPEGCSSGDVVVALRGHRHELDPLAGLQACGAATALSAFPALGPSRRSGLRKDLPCLDLEHSRTCAPAGPAEAHFKAIPQHKAEATQAPIFLSAQQTLHHSGLRLPNALDALGSTAGAAMWRVPMEVRWRMTPF